MGSVSHVNRVILTTAEAQLLAQYLACRPEGRKAARALLRALSLPARLQKRIAREATRGGQ